MAFTRGERAQGKTRDGETWGPKKGGWKWKPSAQICESGRKKGKRQQKRAMNKEMSNISPFKIPWIMNFRGRRILLLSMYRYCLG